MEELDLKKLFELFWEKRIHIIAIVALCAVIGAVYSYFFVTPMYRSQTTLVLTQVSGSQAESTETITTSDVTLNSKLVATYSDLVKSDKVLNKVIANIGINELTVKGIRNNISVTAKNNTEIIEITVKNKNAMYAEKIANETAKQFIETVANEMYKTNNVQIVDEAQVALGPYNIDHKKDIAIFMAVGLVIAAAYVLLLNMLDTTIKTTEDIENNLELPVLTSLPMNDFDEPKGGKR